MPSRPSFLQTTAYKRTRISTTSIMHICAYIVLNLCVIPAWSSQTHNYTHPHRNTNKLKIQSTPTMWNVEILDYFAIPISMRCKTAIPTAVRNWKWCFVVGQLKNYTQRARAGCESCKVCIAINVSLQIAVVTNSIILLIEMLLFGNTKLTND